MTVSCPILSAGAASVDIHRIGAAYCARLGSALGPPEWPQQIRCLALAQGEALTVLFNADWGTWPKLLDETHQIVQRLAPDRRVNVLCFGTRASHNVDFDGIHWGALDPKDRRHDPRQRSQLLEAIRDVSARALRDVRPATVTFGQGRCDSLAVNFYTGAGPTDPTVSVMRIADAGERLIAILVTVACRTDDTDKHLSAGLAGAMGAVVQRMYGPVPVFYLNAGGGDHYPWMALPPVELWEQGREAYQETYHSCLVREYGRLGRLLGSEVCKVIAELEVSGRPLLAQNERWRATSLHRTGPGLHLERPALRVESVPFCLWHRPVPSAVGCVAKVKELETRIRPLLRRLPHEPRNGFKYPLDPSDRQSDLYRLMEIVSQRHYWSGAAGRVKREERYGRPRQVRGEVKVVTFGPIVAVCFPATLCPSAVDVLRAKSPFAFTLFWSEMGPGNISFIIPESLGSLGGIHYGFADYAPAAIDALNLAILQRLHALHDEVAGV